VSTADLIAELERRRVGSVQTNPEVVLDANQREVISCG
jgi:hypothetical protein